MKTPSFYSKSPARFRSGSLAGGLIALAVVASSHLEAAVINGVDFEAVYSGDIMPTASNPAWTQGGAAGSATANSETGLLSLQTNATGSYRYLINDSSEYWGDSSEGITIEFSLRVVSQTGTRATVQVSLGDGERSYNLQIAQSEIFLGQTSTSEASYAMNTMELNTYRITLYEGLMSVYVNQNPIAVIGGYEGVVSSTNEIYFGDGSNFTGGSTQWEYIAFTTSGAFAPIPEPSLPALGGMGALVMLLVASRYRKLSLSPAESI